MIKRYIRNFGRGLRQLVRSVLDVFDVRRISRIPLAVWRVLIALDKFVNAVLLGDPDETMSSRAGRLQGNIKPAYWFCKLLALIDRRHCEKSIQHGEGDDAVSDHPLIFLIMFFGLAAIMIWWYFL